MKKKYKITGVDCANCAAKMERVIEKTDGVEEANLSFMTQKLIIETEETKVENILTAMTKACKKIDRRVKIESIV